MLHDLAVAGLVGLWREDDRDVACVIGHLTFLYRSRLAEGLVYSPSCWATSGNASMNAWMFEAGPLPGAAGNKCVITPHNSYIIPPLLNYTIASS
jgi:hypothetical protein